MRFYIETYGCPMNTAESNAIESLLVEHGWQKSISQEDCDLAVINTCSIRQSAENRIWGRLGSYVPLKKKKKVTVVITGCMAQRLGEDIKKSAPAVDYVIPMNDKLKLLEIISGLEYKPCENYVYTKSYYHEGDFSSLVPIMNGCNNFCSYCIVPYVRGRETSRDYNEIIEEIKFLETKGVKEITLLGQNVNSYRFGDIDFPDLLEKICNECQSIQWIRFDSPHPKDFSDKLIEVIAREDRVAKHLHIPMQSGNTRILNLMNRRYTREQYLGLIQKIKSKIPEITFAVDVMVGFPGETEEEFNDTLSALDVVGYIEAYMYYFNPREGTRAVTMPGQMTEEEKQKRLQILIDKQLAKAAELKSKRCFAKQKVLALSLSRDNSRQMLGRNEHGEMVVFDFDEPIALGSFVTVDFLSLNGNTFVGKLSDV